MKNAFLSMMIFFVISTALTFGQNNLECEKVVKATIDAINNKKSDGLYQYLAEDFEISGQKGDNARMVLSQLFSQLNETVIKFEKISETQTDVITLAYDFTYKKMGKKSTSFIFNKYNKLKGLKLFDMQIQTMQNETKIEKDNRQVITIPFKIIHSLIVVEAELNGIKRSFLIDNGAPKLILNSHYIKKSDSLLNTMEKSNSQGVNGTISGMDIININEFNFYGIKLKNQDVITVDIEHLENELGIEIYGLIGYEIYKDYDLLFDYDKNILTLIQPEFTNTFIKENYKNEKLSEIPFELSLHLATIHAKIGTKELKLAIDCGAQANLIDEKYYIEFKDQIENLKNDELTGADNINKTVNSCVLKNIQIGSKQFSSINTVFNDMKHLNDGYQINIDGIIGYEILSKQKTLLSYKNKKLIFID